MNNDLKVAKTLFIEISNIGREIFFKLPNYDNMLRPVYCVYKENERSNISEHFKINTIKNLIKVFWMKNDENIFNI